MKAFTNVNPSNVEQAVTTLRRAHEQGHAASIAGGGSDLLGMVKEHLVEPDVIVNLKAIHGLHDVTRSASGLTVGGLVTLDAVSRHDLIRREYLVLAEAAGSVGTPQIRNTGTIAGNVCQRPWCWYFRNGFPCFKNGGRTCFAATGENEFHAIFGAGPSHIVHPSDTAVALVALDARFHVSGPSGARVVPAHEFFTLPRVDPARENILTKDEVLTAIDLPAAKHGTHSTYNKVLDREAWTHAVVSAAVVLEMDGATCRRGRVVLGGVAPVPWALPKVDALLTNQQITPELAAHAADVALEGAAPLAKNGYKVPLTKAVIRRTLLSLVAKA